MNEKFITCLKLYCKKHPTVGRPVTVLHKEYLSIPINPQVPLDVFEQGLQALGKTVIKNLEKACIEFMGINSTHSYLKFVTTKENISDKFWLSCVEKANKIVPPGPRPDPTGKNAPSFDVADKRALELLKTPSVLPTPPSPLEIQVKQPEDVLDRVLPASLSGSAPEESSTLVTYDLGLSPLDFDVVKTLADIAGKNTEEFPEYWQALNNYHREKIIMMVSNPAILETMMRKVKKPLIVNMARKRWNELKALKFAIGVVPKEVVPEKPHMVRSEAKTKLPITWDEMTRSERIDFVKKIKDKNFYLYVLGLDKSLAQYVSQVKDIKKNPEQHPNQIKLTTKYNKACPSYISLFRFPSKSVSDESKTLLRSFVAALNKWGRAQLEYTEVLDPNPEIEIREVRR